MVPLQAAVMILVALGALATVLCRDLIRLALMSSLYGLTLVVLFVVYQAPDVALSALVVSSAAFPAVILVAVVAYRRRG
jgi:energy-converting hydrogenase B subunit D